MPGRGGRCRAGVYREVIRRLRLDTVHVNRVEIGGPEAEETEDGPPEKEAERSRSTCVLLQFRVITFSGLSKGPKL